MKFSIITSKRLKYKLMKIANTSYSKKMKSSIYKYSLFKLFMSEIVIIILIWNDLQNAHVYKHKAV